MKSSAALVIGVVMVALFAGAAALSTWIGGASGDDALVPCGRPVTVLADDGAEVLAVSYRCDAVPGKHPALAVWPREPGAATGFLAPLDRWAREGRTLFVVTGPRRPGAEYRDLDAVLAALTDDPAVDPGRLGVLVEGGVAHAFSPEGASRWPEALDALVVCDPPEDVRAPLREAGAGRALVLVAEGRGAAPGDGEEALPRRTWRVGRPALGGSAERADAWLWEALDAAPLTSSVAPAAAEAVP